VNADSNQMTQNVRVASEKTATDRLCLHVHAPSSGLSVITIFLPTMEKTRLVVS
jgi:hypothetical protein